MKPPLPLLLVAQKLGPLRERVVFVGGMIRGLLSTDPAAGPVRPTDDVDLIVDVPTLTDYHALGVTLRASGFREDTREGAPLCRWIVDEVTTDVMPIDPGVLGFSNVWYESALQHVSTTRTEEGALRHLDAPHFCATKVEAFASRAHGDYYHHDIEDFIAIVDERAELIDEIAAAPNDLREFLVTSTRELLQTPQFVEALRGHLSGDEVGDQRLPGLIAKLQRFAALTAPGKPSRTPPKALGGGFAQPKIVQVASPSGTRAHVQSSNLDWVEYDAQHQSLLVGFNAGTVYRYSGVPTAVYQGLLDAYSKGRYFHVWIRRRYACTQVR